MSFIVGIDGPAGTGKGTITELLAKKYNLLNIDTGATYRCVALEMLNKKIKLDDDEKIADMLKSIKIEINNNNGVQEIYLNGENVTKKIRTSDVTNIVSQVSSIKQIRVSMANLQRKMAQGHDVIMEGRDICTVVFPTADVKIYLDADVEERARRRFKQNKENGMEMSYEAILENIKMRDKNDKEKELGALKVADGAVVIDSTKLTINQVEKQISIIINKTLKNKKKEEKIYKERPETVLKRAERATIKAILRAFCKISFRVKKVNENNIPENEACIICANHLNLLDAMTLVVCSKKKIRFIGKEDLFNNVFLNWLAHIFDVIPIKRGMRDMEAMKKCVKALKNGEILGIFPEGTRRGLEKGTKVKNGAAYMALKTKVKIIPVGIAGSFKPFSKVILNYGKPLDFSKYDKEYPEKDQLDIATKEVIDNIIMLTNTAK